MECGAAWPRPSPSCDTFLVLRFAVCAGLQAGVHGLVQAPLGAHGWFQLPDLPNSFAKFCVTFWSD